MSPTLYQLSYRGNLIYSGNIVNFENIFAIILPTCARPERVWPKLSSIQGIRVNLVYIVSLRAPRIAELCERVLMAKLVESIRLGRVEL